MIRGPWPLAADKASFAVPLEGPFLTPIYRGERVALRVSKDDHDKALRRGPGLKCIVTDLDDEKRYAVFGMPCSSPHCYCDAEIFAVSEGRRTP